jgi:hypothetical protein
MQSFNLTASSPNPIFQVECDSACFLNDLSSYLVNLKLNKFKYKSNAPPYQCQSSAGLSISTNDAFHIGLLPPLVTAQFLSLMKSFSAAKADTVQKCGKT